MVAGTVYVKELLPQPRWNRADAADRFPAYEFKPASRCSTDEEFERVMEQRFPPEPNSPDHGLPRVILIHRDGLTIALGPEPYFYNDSVLGFVLPDGVPLSAINDRITHWCKTTRCW